MLFPSLISFPLHSRGLGQRWGVTNPPLPPRPSLSTRLRWENLVCHRMPSFCLFVCLFCSKNDIHEGDFHLYTWCRNFPFISYSCRSSYIRSKIIKEKKKKGHTQAQKQNKHQFQSLTKIHTDLVPRTKLKRWTQADLPNCAQSTKGSDY